MLKFDESPRDPKEFQLKVGIIGARSRSEESDFRKIHKAFRYVMSDLTTWEGIPDEFEKTIDYITVVSGGARQGGDAFAMILADFYKIPEDRRMIFKPKPELHGYPKCYFIRNDMIARVSNMLIAAQDPKQKPNKGGTNYTINRFVKLKSKKDLFIV